jgi:hypothetical protein
MVNCGLQYLFKRYHSFGLIDCLHLSCLQGMLVKLLIMKILIILLFAIFIFSCSKQRCERSVWANATVVNAKDINCDAPVLSFKEDSVKVCRFTGNAEALDYVVHGLPPQCNAQGTKLFVQIAPLGSQDRCTCLTSGPSYPAIKILDAKAR